MTTWNPGDKDEGISLSNGDLTATYNSGSSYKGVRAIRGLSTEKVYWEVQVFNPPGDLFGPAIGVTKSTHPLSSSVGDNRSDGWGYNVVSAQKVNETKTVFTADDFASGDIIGVALDMSAGKIWWSKNGVWLASGDPANGLNAAFANVTGTVYPTLTIAGIGDGTNRGILIPLAFNYPKPAGFSALTLSYLLGGTINKGGLAQANKTVLLVNEATGEILSQEITDVNGEYEATAPDGTTMFAHIAIDPLGIYPPVCAHKTTGEQG